MNRIFIGFYFLVFTLLSHAMHIGIPSTDIGIGGLLSYAPKVGDTLIMLAEVLLRDESSLECSDRELIAAYVSYLNECQFCCNCHSAIAAYLLQGNSALVEMVKEDPSSAPISDKLKALLQLAALVQKGGHCVTHDCITHARACGATDRDIHDTVLIAAAFCMFNRYVDGLAAWTPADASIYQEIGEAIAQYGYVKALHMLLCTFHGEQRAIHG